MRRKQTGYEWDIFEIVIHELCHVFGAGIGVRIGCINVADPEGAAGLRQ
jgi:hypothetical protein